MTSPRIRGPFPRLNQFARNRISRQIYSKMIRWRSRSRYFRARGIPSYELVPGMFSAEDLKGFHGLDERMSIENLRLGTQIIHDATLRVAAKGG